jgi:NADPH-dependent 2,4-dienoyl-CoA reductase/sulfur reductase-like enzyme
VEVDVIVIGAGPAGLAAAIEAKEAGVGDVLVVERDKEPGGILQQCIHNGFGLHVFGCELTGPEYAQRFIDEAEAVGVKILLDSMVLSVDSDKKVIVLSPKEGLIEYSAKAVILAMGCRERTRGALQIPGSRPAGVLTAGAAQRFVNKEGYLPGREIVILGSGDIGLIMARRLTLEGAKVKLVCELMPYSGGLNRNIVQCLEDFNIPLLLSTTVVKIHGMERIEAVTIAQVDENLKPIPETCEMIPCDTLLLSVGLIPENELSLEAGIEIDPVTQGPIVNDSRETTVPGIYACGNVVHVHDLVDYVTEEARLAGRSAARDVLKADQKAGTVKSAYVKTKAGEGVRYIVPQKIRVNNGQDKIGLFFRVNDIYTDKTISVNLGEQVLLKKKRKKLAPGEMEHIELPAKSLKYIESTESVTISIESEGERH